MKKILPILIFPLVLMLASCQVQCSDPPFLLYFSGFDSSALALVKFSKYEKYSDFTKLSETIYAGTPRRKMDTFQLSRSYQSSFYGTYQLDRNYDYIVEVISSGAVYKVTGLTSGHGKTYNTNNGCTNSASWYVNGAHFKSIEYENSTSGAAQVTLLK